MTSIKASIRDELQAKLHGGNGPSSIGNVILFMLHMYYNLYSNYIFILSISF
ncbi:hypothetical protein LguiA_017990 [Lonicera macranthoides]